MSKFFNVVSKNSKRNNGSMNNNPNVPIQGYIAPSNMNRDPYQGNYNQNNMMGPSNMQNGMPNQVQNNMPNQMNQMPNNVPNNNQNYMNNGQVRVQNNQAYFNNNVNNVNEVLDVSMADGPQELNPLNNANNPVPVNPVAPAQPVFVEEDLPKNVKANVFSVIGMMFGMILTPGTTIVNNSKKYRSTFKALMITIWITIVTLILCIGVRVLVGSFSRTYSVVTGASRVSFNLGNILTLDNYIPYLIIAFLMSFVCILVMSFTYYASSFLNSKGVPLGSYIMVSNLALLPIIIGSIVAYPAVNLISGYLAGGVLIFTFLYSLIAFEIGISEILTFKNINRKILYNVLNLSVVILVMIIIFSIFIKLNILLLPELSI